MSVDLVRRRFTVDEYLKMVESGILNEDDRVELLDGEIVKMPPPPGPDHNACTGILNRLLVLGVGSRAVVLPGPTLRLSKRSAPEPDFVLLRTDPRNYRDSYAEPGDVLLLVEISDSSLRRDREIKLPLYAAAGIPEYWIVDVQNEAVEVCKDPAGSSFASVRQYRRGESVSPSAFPDLRIAVDEIFA
jgi:Uma2 family endonuclease